MAESAVSFLLDHLSEWLENKRQLLGGLATEVDYIRIEMGQMRAFLRVADANEETNPSLKEWVSQVRDISYDVQDILDKYQLLFHEHPDTNGLSGYITKRYSSIKNSKAKHKIACEIQEIKGRLENASKSYNRYREMYDVSHVTGRRSKDEWWDGRDNALFLDDSDVVGIEKPKKQLIEWIMLMNTDGLNVISIVGMGGLGKTTLAKKVYDDETVKRHFNRHVWIVASDFGEVKHLLANLISKLVKEMKDSPTLPRKIEEMSDDEMREFIYNLLAQEKYIIVLDDVWDVSRWEAIKFCFPQHGCIIITTRFNSIGKSTCIRTNHVYNLEPLPFQESDELFYRKAFPRNSCPPYLEEYAASILKRCEGLPLAIVVIGGLLATKENRVEEWDLFNRSLGDELEEGGALHRLSKILSLGYYDLPYHLKYCFLYLSVFPDGCLLEKWKIVRLWVAEGFVKVKQGMTMEEVAESYLNEILSRSLIQVADRALDGRPKTFRVHDLLREYICSKSREQNIVSIHDGTVEMKWPNKIRRIVIQKSLDFVQGKYGSFKYLRTLILVSIEYRDLKVIKEIIEKCRLLKVLSLEGAPLETIPNEIFKLYHLKHLCLRKTMVKIIPKSIKNLRNLETLDLKHTNVTKLPNEILKLRKLRHLLVYKYEDIPGVLFYKLQGVKAPCNIGDCLLSLQKLSCIVAEEVGGVKIVKEIGKLTELRRLGIMELRKEDGMELCSSIANLTNLRSLLISADEMLDLDYHYSSSINLPFLRTLYLRGCLENVPQWVSSLVGLTDLFLSYCKIREDIHMLHCLESLPNLAIMRIHDANVDGLVFKAHGFRKLKELWLEELKHLKCVVIEKGSMPLLNELTMWSCKLITDVPRGIEHLSNLRVVDFLDMGDEFMKRVGDEKREGGDDWRLGHIPSVRLFGLTGRGWEEMIS
ncbi:hypothetical protein CASFOL_018697 [Castilleja foliolosa]|uniref:Uncharacterized protein n=1 Tax=Castilleja foliolosa TaxID=1961234 RepID=A0ABD3D6R2_9LAMI